MALTRRNDEELISFITRAQTALNYPPQGYQVDGYQLLQETEQRRQSYHIIYKEIPQHVSVEGRKFKQENNERTDSNQ